MRPGNLGALHQGGSSQWRKADLAAAGFGEVPRARGARPPFVGAGQETQFLFTATGLLRRTDAKRTRSVLVGRPCLAAEGQQRRRNSCWQFCQRQWCCRRHCNPTAVTAVASTQVAALLAHEQAQFAARSRQVIGAVWLARRVQDRDTGANPAASRRQH